VSSCVTMPPYVKDLIGLRSAGLMEVTLDGPYIVGLT